MKIIQGYVEEKNIGIEELKIQIGNDVILNGSIYKIRKMSDFAFVLIRTRREIVQCIYLEQEVGVLVSDLKEESCVTVTASVKEEPRSKTGVELVIKKMELRSVPQSLCPIVINHKNVDASIDTLLDYRVITLRNEKERAIFKIQEGVVDGIREFLKKQEFTEIRTPKIVYAGAEGGANIFHLDYFGKDAYLAQSPQFYKQMMVGAYERVFEIGPVFRAEKHDTSRHLNEYTSIDFEMGYINNYEDIMQMETKMLRYLFTYLKENYSHELTLWNVVLPEVKEIPVILFHEAKELIAREYQREITDQDDMEPEEEKLLCKWMSEHMGSEFVFVTGYPSKKRPFYAMETPGNTAITESFDLLFRGIEITTGGQRIHTYEEQVAKMEMRGMDISKFKTYLQMHQYGMPPHGGLGLGLERLTCKLLNLDNVRYTTLFPRDIKRLEP